MAGEKWYRVNKPGVIQEVLDGEAVIVNLTTGSYYSTGALWGDDWSLLARGAADGARYRRAPPDTPHRGAKRRRQARTTVAGRTGGREPGCRGPPRGGGRRDPIDVVTEEGKTKTRFVEPKFEKYTDMEDLLLLDPIHDVQETGWPRTSDKAAE